MTGASRRQVPEGRGGAARRRPRRDGGGDGGVPRTLRKYKFKHPKYSDKFRHPKYKFRHPKYSDISFRSTEKGP